MLIVREMKKKKTQGSGLKFDNDRGLEQLSAQSPSDSEQFGARA